MEEKTLVVIPTFNEIENIKRMILKLFELYPDIHLLIIDDNSPDGTARIVKQFRTEYANLHLIEREGKLGLGTAYKQGFLWAIEQKYDYIIQMDCDFSHDPKELKSFLMALKNENFDLVVGSRYIDGIRIYNWPFKRLILSYFGSIFIRYVTSLPMMDITGGFKGWRRNTLEAIDIERVFSNGYSFQIEMNYKAWVKGKRIKEVPILFKEREEGVSKMSFNIVLEALVYVFKLRFLKIVGSL